MGPGTFQLRVRARRHAPVSAKPSVSGKPGWPALDSFTGGIIYGCHEAASECRAQRECVVVSVGCRSDRRRDFPQGAAGQVLGMEHNADLWLLTAGQQNPEVGVSREAALPLPGHFVVKALMRCQLSRVHLQPLHTAFLVWNVPCCSPDEVLPPHFHLDLSSV